MVTILILKLKKKEEKKEMAPAIACTNKKDKLENINALIPTP